MWVRPKDHKVVGEILAEARKTAGVTQDELGARLQKPQSFVSAYERGQRRVDLLEFLILMDAIKTAPEAVFGRIRSAGETIVRRARRPVRHS